MKQSRITKQFNEVIEHSVDSKGNTFCLVIKGDEIELLGITQGSIKPQEAIVFIQKDKEAFIQGFFDKKKFEHSSIEYLIAPSSILIGVDNRDKEDNIVYLQCGDYCERTNSKSSFNTGDSLNIYWEYGAYSCLTVCTYDPIQDEIVRELVMANNEPLKRFLKTIVRTLLLSVEKSQEPSIEPSNFDDFLESQFEYEEEEYDHKDFWK